MKFDFDNVRPIYLQLVEQLERYIVSGNLKPGDKLPSVRELAMSSKTNPNTVQKALTELENLGLIYTERTNGKYVSTDETLIQKHGEKYAKVLTEKYLDDMTKLGFTIEQAKDYTNKFGGKNERNSKM